jgi:hypothetical protein
MPIVPGANRLKLTVAAKRVPHSTMVSRRGYRINRGSYSLLRVNPISLQLEINTPMV